MDTSSIQKRAKKDGIQRFVVGAVIVDLESILFVRRAQDDFMGGVYELPSGKVDEREGLIDALKREVQEETNLVVDDIISLFDTFDYKSKSGTQTRQFNFLVSIKNAGVLKLDHKEHDLHKWIKFEDIESSEILDNMMKPIAMKAVQIARKVNSLK